MPPVSSLPPSELSPSPVAALPHRNLLALISLVLGAVAPIVALIALGASLLHATGVSNYLAWVLGELTVPLGLAAIVCGHIALLQAKRSAAAQARRTSALLGLVLGYGSLAAFAVFIAYILATFH